jgi:hypothetical protein
MDRRINCLTAPKIFSHLTNSDSDLPSLLHTCCNPAAMRVTRYGKSGHNGHSYPIFGDRMDILPPYVGDGHYGRPTLLSYTEKVRGSSPFAPTKIPPPTGFFSCWGPEISLWLNASKSTLVAIGNTPGSWSYGAPGASTL